MPVTVKLSKPVKAGDTEVEELVLDFDRLTGKDIEIASRESLEVSGQPPTAMVLDVSFHAHVAARAAGVEAAVVRNLPAKDYVRVTTEAAGFLLSSD